MQRTVISLLNLLLVTCLLIPATANAQSEAGPVVQAVLFYSPSCPHCHTVIQEVLVPMVEEYGDQLQIIGIDTSQPEGSQLYQTAIDHYQIPSQRRGVPTLIVSDTILVGSGEIPEKFPGIVEEGLAAEGIAWPDIPGFQPEAVPTGETEAPTETPPTATTPAEAEPAQTLPTVPATEAEEEVIPTVEPEMAAAPVPTQEQPAIAIGEEAVPTAEAEAPPPDPVGMGLAGGLVVLMVVAFIYALWRIMLSQPLQQLFSSRTFSTYATTWAIPVLALLGLGVSIYLAYVEVSQVEAVCGPVGHCNIVQTSPYARLLGIPIAILGLLNYIAIIVLWTGQRVEPVAHWSALGLLALTLFGTLFSIYLTLLEIFVIRAICMWCLSSALITTILMLVVVMPLTGRSRLQQQALSH